MDKGGPVDGRFYGEDPVDHCSLVLHDYATMCETIPETVASMPMDRELFHMLKSLLTKAAFRTQISWDWERGASPISARSLSSPRSSLSVPLTTGNRTQIGHGRKFYTWTP